ncbi:MAG: hypothetical protein CME90_05980 [Hoeflea sp.]|nr:hypothetical protein [Hoeflea sp.]
MEDQQVTTETPTAVSGDRVSAAAVWYGERSGHVECPIPLLKSRFGLTAKEAIKAMRIATGGGYVG